MEKIKNKNNSAVSIQLNLGCEDKILDLISRPSGLFAITKEKILSVVTPDRLDPYFEHEDAPCQQNIICSVGSKNYIVARTIIQSKNMLNAALIAQNDNRFIEVMEISWEVMHSLLALKAIKDKLELSINEKIKQIEDNVEIYVYGESPGPLPRIESLQTDFTSFAIEVKKCLKTIFDLLNPLTKIAHRGAFNPDIAINKLKESYGEDDVLTKLVNEDKDWQKLWIEIRNFIEHPKQNKKIIVNNFRLEANRSITIPTWQFIHPDYPEIEQPQQLLFYLENCINNMLSFYEEFLLLLIEKQIPTYLIIELEIIDKKDRNIDCPVKFKFSNRINPNISQST